jgi:hypothetical protein
VYPNKTLPYSNSYVVRVHQFGLGYTNIIILLKIFLSTATEWRAKNTTFIRVFQSSHFDSISTPFHFPFHFYFMSSELPEPGWNRNEGYHHFGIYPRRSGGAWITYPQRPSYRANWKLLGSLSSQSRQLEHVEVQNGEQWKECGRIFHLGSVGWGAEVAEAAEFSFTAFRYLLNLVCLAHDDCA